jgi:hypothetical protein
MNEPNAEHLQQIEDCENRESRLDDWQRGFIDSVKRQIMDGRPLSRSQVDKLDETWEAATAKG